VRQPGQPSAQQRVDVLRTERVADPLQRRRVVDGSEPVVQRFEPDPGLRGLPLRPVIAVEAQLGGVREVAGELQEERAEVGVDAVEVPLV
jgi:hypothetical protein